MTHKAPRSGDKPLTLCDDDIGSQRVTRRSLLGTLGLGAGVAAAATLVAAGTATADSDTKGKEKKPPKKPGKPKEETDSD